MALLLKASPSPSPSPSSRHLLMQQLLCMIIVLSFSASSSLSSSSGAVTIIEGKVFNANSKAEHVYTGPKNERGIVGSLCGESSEYRGMVEFKLPPSLKKQEQQPSTKATLNCTLAHIWPVPGISNGECGIVADYFTMDAVTYLGDNALTFSDYERTDTTFVKSLSTASMTELGKEAFRFDVSKPYADAVAKGAAALGARFQVSPNGAKTPYIVYFVDCKLAVQECAGTMDAAGKNALKGVEKLARKAYIDTTCHFTIGYGFTNNVMKSIYKRKIRYSDEMTKKQADKIFDKHIKSYEAKARKVLGEDCCAPQHVFNGVAIAVYNCWSCLNTKAIRNACKEENWSKIGQIILQSGASKQTRTVANRLIQKKPVTTSIKATGISRCQPFRRKKCGKKCQACRKLIQKEKICKATDKLP